MPSVAAVEGYCLGGGLALAAVCDLRVATRSSRFGVPIARTLGNCLSMNSVSVRRRPPRRLAHPRPAAPGPAVGRRRGGTPPASSPRCATTATSTPRCRTSSTRCCGHAPLTMWASKVAVARLRRQSLPDGDDLVGAAFGSEDFRRAVAGFGSGERATWEGR